MDLNNFFNNFSDTQGFFHFHFFSLVDLVADFFLDFSNGVGVHCALLQT